MHHANEECDRHCVQWRLSGPIRQAVQRARTPTSINRLSEALGGHLDGVVRPIGWFPSLRRACWALPQCGAVPLGRSYQFSMRRWMPGGVLAARPLPMRSAAPRSRRWLAPLVHRSTHQYMQVCDALRGRSDDPLRHLRFSGGSSV